MNPFQAHFLTNHIPVIGYPFVVLLIVWALLNREEISRARLAFVLLCLVSVAAVAAHISGEQAEHAMHNSNLLLETDRAFLENHEEIAEKLNPVAFAGIILGIAGLVCMRIAGQFIRPLLMISLLLSAGASVFSGYIAHTGGLIRHPEIRSGSSQTQILSPKQEAVQPKLSVPDKDHSDDDHDSDHKH